MIQKHFTDCFWAYDTKDITVGLRTLNSKYQFYFKKKRIIIYNL